MSRTMTPADIAVALERNITSVRKLCIHYKPKRQVHQSERFKQNQRLAETRSRLQLMASDLARHDRCPVYLCTRSGNPKSDGDMVRYGTKIISINEASAKAERKGLL